jgi:hypothetical protein
LDNRSFRANLGAFSAFGAGEIVNHRNVSGPPFNAVFRARVDTAAAARAFHGVYIKRLKGHASAGWASLSPDVGLQLIFEICKGGEYGQCRLFSNRTKGRVFQSPSDFIG